MRHTLTIPADLYLPILTSTLLRFEAAIPTRTLSELDITDDDLKQLRSSRDDLVEASGILDQLDRSTRPREIAIAAEGELMRNIANGAVEDTILLLSSIAQPVFAHTDLDRYTAYTPQIDSLTDLPRIVQHDHDRHRGTA